MLFSPHYFVLPFLKQYIFIVLLFCVVYCAYTFLLRMEILNFLIMFVLHARVNCVI